MIGTITVKGVKIVQALSEETLCFTATVYEDGKKIGTASNRGHGGCTDIDLDNRKSKTYEEQSILIEKIDELVYAFDNEQQTAKMQKKLERDCAKAICVGWINKHGASYWKQGFKSNPTLAEVARTPKGVQAIQRLVDSAKTQITADETILNTNLEALGVKL